MTEKKFPLYQLYPDQGLSFTNSTTNSSDSGN